MAIHTQQIISPIQTVSLDDIEFVGGKAAALGELMQNFPEGCELIPQGFVITRYAYETFLEDQQDIRDRHLHRFQLVCDIHPFDMGSGIILFSAAIPGLALFAVLADRAIHQPLHVRLCPHP